MVCITTSWRNLEKNKDISNIKIEEAIHDNKVNEYSRFDHLHLMLSVANYCSYLDFHNSSYLYQKSKQTMLLLLLFTLPQVCLHIVATRDIMLHTVNFAFLSSTDKVQTGTLQNKPRYLT